MSHQSLFTTHPTSGLTPGPTVMSRSALCFVNAGFVYSFFGDGLVAFITLPPRAAINRHLSLTPGQR